MSVIGKVPYVNKIIGLCSKNQAKTISNLLDSLGETTTLSLYGTDYLINSSLIGQVLHVSFMLEQVSNKTIDGILVYLSDDNCALFGVNDFTGIITEFSIDPVHKVYSQINEHCTAEELRQVVGDALIEMGEGSAVSEDEVPGLQATTTVVADALTNLNGRKLTSYEATLTEDAYTFYTITKDSKKLTEEQAKDYMEYMTGSRFLPKYNFEKPQNSMWIMADGSYWKPQYDATNGMRLYKLRSDKEVLSQIECVYDEDNNQTIITFPENVLPLRFYIYLEGTVDDTWFFDYNNRFVYSGNDSDYSTFITIDIQDKRVIIAADGEYGIDASESDLTFIYFNNEENNLNTFKMYYPNPYNHSISIITDADPDNPLLTFNVVLTAGYLGGDVDVLWEALQTHRFNSAFSLSDEETGDNVIAYLSLNATVMQITGLDVDTATNYTKTINKSSIVSFNDNFVEIE